MAESRELPPDAELDVMSCLWKEGPATAGQIRETLRERRPMAHATVCTLLKRLEEKGCVSREKASRGKAFIYQAELKPTGPARQLLQGLCDRLFGGDTVALVASLMDSRPPTADELSDLERLVGDLKNQRRRRKRSSS